MKKYEKWMCVMLGMRKIVDYTCCKKDRVWAFYKKNSSLDMLL
jgi:hypothetical protein